MFILEDLISPLTLKEFEDHYLFKEPFAAPFKAQRLSELIYWPLLWEIFASGHPNCWLPKEGQLPAEPELATGRLTFEQAVKGFKEGRTILIRHAEMAHPKLAEIANNFHQAFNDPVDIQIYCTPPYQEGFNWHYDVEEVFVIQSVGQKEFRLKKNTVNPLPVNSQLPIDMHFEQETSKGEIRCLLQAGDWLYIPSGYWHKAQALTPSFHLSVGVMAQTGLDYFSSSYDEIKNDFDFKKRLPLKKFNREAYQKAIEDLSKKLPNETQRIWTKEVKSELSKSGFFQNS